MRAYHNDWRSQAVTGLKSIRDAANALTGFQVGIMVTLVLLLVMGAAYSYLQSRPRTVKVLDRAGAAAAGGNSAGKASKTRLAVHVAGAVNRPGLYMVAEGSRVADALDSAGGPAPDALLDNLNLAARLKDGEKVMVPRVNQGASDPQAVPGETSTTSAASINTVNINVAGVDDLDRLPGVGPALSRRIVEYRQKNGQFSSVEELDNVEGIGPSKMESLRDLVNI
jgi:competence protein ComEA